MKNERTSSVLQDRLSADSCKSGKKRSDSLELQVYKYEYPYFRECQLQLHTVITSTAQNDVNLADFVKVDVDNDNGNPPS